MHAGPPGGSWALLVVLLGALVALLGAFWSLLACLACFLSLSWANPIDLGPILLLLGHIFIDLGWTFDALATLRIELPPAWELNFHVFPLWRFTTFRKQDLLPYIA